jgi:hypothetical protein
MYHVRPGQGLVITIYVMTFSEVSAKDHDPIGPLIKGGKYHLRMNHAGTHNPDNPNVRRILHSRSTREIGGCVRTPVAAEGNYFWFIFHCLSLHKYQKFKRQERPKSGFQVA